LIAAVIGPGGRVGVEERPDPRPAPGEALIRVNLAGICSTDLELARGYMGFQGIPGHEFIGTVLEAPPDAADLVGSRVVGEINAACGACSYCADGLGRHCPSRTVLGIHGRPGAFAELLTLPVANLHRVPAKLSSERALFTEPLAAAFEILTQVEVSRGQEVLVLGDGKLGALCARVLGFAGALVTVAGRHEAKLAPLREEGFATVVDGAEAAAPLLRRFDLVIEASGRPEGIERALAYLRPRGRIVLKSTCAGSKPLNLAPVVVDEITVVGSRCGPFAPALNALATGAIKPELTIDARFPLGRAAGAFEAAASAGARKVIFEVSS
jgi:threonine dehydrogenase-like Zn-dependent dehydrogenase